MQDCQDEMKSVWCLAIFPSDYDCLNQTLWAVQSSKTTFSPGKAVCIKPGLVVCLNDCADLCSSHTHTKRKTCVMYATGHADSSDYCKSGSAQASGSMSPNESTRHRTYPLISTKVWWLLTILRNQDWWWWSSKSQPITCDMFYGSMSSHPTLYPMKKSLATLPHLCSGE